MNAELERQIGELHRGDHVCLIYESSDEQLAAAVPFIRDGLRLGERCVYITDDRTADEVSQALFAAGVDVAGQRSRGALVLETQRETYLRDGSFDPRGMIEFLRGATEDAADADFTGLRVTGEMTWALGSDTPAERVIEYEALLNEFFPGSRACAVCQYNRSRFPAEVIEDVLRTHPVAVLGDQVCPNLYYEPPELVLGVRSASAKVDWMIQQLRRARASEQAVQEASRAKSDFLATMSHELRTPLNAIIGYADLLLSGIPEPIADGPRRQVERVQASARHLLALIEEILRFSRLEGGREELALDRVDLNGVARDAAQLVHPLAEEKGLEFRLALPSRSVWLETDAGKVRQILLNLLSNAVKFTEAGEVELGLHATGREVELRVRDTGPGIAPEELERIFEPFRQVELVTTRRAGGAGLGLSVARRLARLLGGELTVRSEPGRGSTFALRLPRAPATPNGAGDRVH